MSEMFRLLESELGKAGQDYKQLALLNHLEERRITPDKEIPPMQFFFQMFGKPCFARGELVALAGKAKSGKTFVSSILMALCFRREVLTVKRIDEAPLSVLWFDTEQSEESTQDILKNRIISMIRDDPEASSLVGDDDSSDGEWNLGNMFHIFNVRADFWQERLPLLEAAIKEYHSDLVILDGIRDLVNDINDSVMAQDVIERLMHIASEQNCCIVTILHQNKGAEDKNLRGWIGTVLRNKAFEVYECIKDSDRIFTWCQTDTRKYDIMDKLKYTVGEDGIPVLCSVDLLLETAKKDSQFRTDFESRPRFNEEYVIHGEDNHIVINIEKLFTAAFKPGEELPANILQERVMSMCNITSYKFYNYRREEALSKGIIVQRQDANKHHIYTCPSKASQYNDEDLFSHIGSLPRDVPS